MSTKDNRLSNVDSELDKEVIAFLKSYRKFLKSWAGGRCSDRQPGCCVCRAWALYDAVELSFDLK